MHVVEKHREESGKELKHRVSWRVTDLKLI